jgi:cytochrome c peroxidase
MTMHAFRPALSFAALLLVALGLRASGPEAPLGLDVYRPIPADNPLTPAKIALGRRLFEDRRLSQDGTVACATCHDPSRAFTDGRAVAIGVGGLAGRRNAPTLVNRAYGRSFFWDGRAASLEQQVVQPLLDPREMAAAPDAVVTFLRRDGAYRRQFTAAIGRDPQWDDVARALASYVRTIRSGDSRYDRYRYGTPSALTPQEQRGMRLFLEKANCWSCHSGPNLSDERFHNTGIAFRGEELLDAVRFAVTQHPRDRGAFKTPTLRDVARTAPYMHDGSVATLNGVVEYYDRGGNANPGLDTLIRSLRMSVEEKRDLVAFLRSLSGRISQED